MPRLAGLWPFRYASGLRGFSTGHPALAKNWPASLRATLRAFLHPPAAVIRGPREPRAKTRAKAKSKGQEQRPRAKAKSKGQEQRPRAKAKSKDAGAENAFVSPHPSRP